MSASHLVIFGILMMAGAASTQAKSFISERLEDPAAIYLQATGDGLADDTDAVQAAINRVVETTTWGIVFIPSGIYRLSKPIHIWPGIRLIGCGKTRPLFKLADNTPGYQGDPAYLFHFAGNTPGHPGGSGYIFQPGAARPKIDFSVTAGDAHPGTFYSAMSNVDFIIGEGNPGAVAVRSTFAQHCFLSHIDFNLGSGLAGIHDGGNVCENLRFIGGKYGIITRTPSPGWPYCLVDASFEGQSVAAIQSEISGLTLIRPSFKNVPTAISMNPEIGEQLSIKDGRMENITGPALIIGNEQSARNQINLRNVVCERVPTFAKYAESGKSIPAPGEIYQVAEFSHGLHVSGGGRTIEDFVTGTRSRILPIKEMPPPVASDITALPPLDTWVNVRTLGLVGDGIADETEALRKAITNHRSLYFPSGAYRISDTLVLKPDTAMIGLNPGSTRIFISDDSPKFQGIGGPVPLIEAPSGGANIMIGIGIYTNGNNPRAVAVKWMSGENSLMNDVRMLGGHGTAELSGERAEIYNSDHSGDPDPRRRWDSQYPSLWVTDGGGGTFMDIWTPSTFAQSGMLVSNTSTPGRIYAMSVEHHRRNEVVLRNVSNWEFHALQLELERGEGGSCLPLSVESCENVSFHNLFIYRVISSYLSSPSSVSLADSSNIRFEGFRAWTNSRVNFDNSIIDAGKQLELRQHEFASFTSPAQSITPSKDTLRKVAGGFVRLSGGAVDPKGRFYAVDPRQHRIYRWATPDSAAEIISDAPIEPMNLAFDASGNLLVISYTGSVVSLNPDKPDQPIQLLKAQSAAAHPNANFILPVNHWSGFRRDASGLTPKNPAQFVSADGSTVIPADEAFLTGKLSWGVKHIDLIRAFGLAPARPDRPVFVTYELEGRTYSASLDEAGNLIDYKLFAHRGGEAVARDSDGKVFIAEGHVFVYDPKGELLKVIPMPERPLGLVFGDTDGRTLYIPAGTSLYVFESD